MSLFKSKKADSSTPKLTPAELPAAKFTDIWHIWDFIQANIPISGQKPSWERVTTYPLEPRPLFRRWCSSTELIGVSFGATTGYFLADIDIHSLYHPQNSRENFRLFLSCWTSGGIRAETYGFASKLCPIGSSDVGHRFVKKTLVFSVLRFLPKLSLDECKETHPKIKIRFSGSF